MFESGPVEVSHVGEHIGSWSEPGSLTVGCDQNEGSSTIHVVRDVGSDGAGWFEVEGLGEGVPQRNEVDARIETVNRSHAQLVGDQFAHVGHGGLGASVGPGVVRPLLVAESATDGVSVMAVGDHDVVAGHCPRDGGDTLGVAHPLENVANSVDVDRAERFSRFGEKVGEASGQ